MNIISELYIHLNYSKIGQDQFGNSYYQSIKKNPNTKLFKRVVIYKGLKEPSKIPPLWHAWLHNYLSEIPSQTQVLDCDWYKEKIPNLTGTKLASFPLGHIAHGGKRSKVSSDYSAWNPNDIKTEEHE